MAPKSTSAAARRLAANILTPQPHVEKRRKIRHVMGGAKALWACSVSNKAAKARPSSSFLNKISAPVSAFGVFAANKADAQCIKRGEIIAHARLFRHRIASAAKPVPAGLINQWRLFSHRRQVFLCGPARRETRSCRQTGAVRANGIFQ